MIRSSHVGIALAFAAVLSMTPCMGAFAQSNGCNQTGRTEGNRQNLAQAENSSSGGGMYGRQYSQAEGNRGTAGQLAQAEQSGINNGRAPGQLAQNLTGNGDPCR